MLGLFVGVYIDRWDRKRTMILADSFHRALHPGTSRAVLARRRGVVARLPAAGVPFGGFGLPRPGHAGPRCRSWPCRQLTRIAGVNQVITSFSDLIGPALGALLLGLTSIGNILLLDVLRSAHRLHDPALHPYPPTPNVRTAAPTCGGSSAKALPPCTPNRDWAGSSGLAIAVWFLIMPVGFSSR